MSWAPLVLFAWGILSVCASYALHARALRKLRARDERRRRERWERAHCFAPVTFGSDVAPANDVTRSARGRAA